jgi:hypothetical protein
MRAPYSKDRRTLAGIVLHARAAACDPLLPLVQVRSGRSRIYRALCAPSCEVGQYHSGSSGK